MKSGRRMKKTKNKKWSNEKISHFYNYCMYSLDNNQ